MTKIIYGNRFHSTWRHAQKSLFASKFLVRKYDILPRNTCWRSRLLWFVNYLCFSKAGSTVEARVGVAHCSLAQLAGEPWRTRTKPEKMDLKVAISFKHIHNPGEHEQNLIEHIRVWPVNTGEHEQRKVRSHFPLSQPFPSFAIIRPTRFLNKNSLFNLFLHGD